MSSDPSPSSSLAAASEPLSTPHGAQAHATPAPEATPANAIQASASAGSGRSKLRSGKEHGHGLPSPPSAVTMAPSAKAETQGAEPAPTPSVFGPSASPFQGATVTAPAPYAVTPVPFPNLFSVQAESRWECPEIPFIRLSDSIQSRAAKGVQFIQAWVLSLMVAHPAPVPAELGAGLFKRANLPESRRSELHEWYLSRVTVDILGTRGPRAMERSECERLLAEAKAIFWPEGEDPPAVRKEWESLTQGPNDALRLFAMRWLERLKKVHDNPVRGVAPLSGMEVASRISEALTKDSLALCGGLKKLQALTDSDGNFRVEEFLNYGIQAEHFNRQLRSQTGHGRASSTQAAPAAGDRQQRPKDRSQRRRDERKDRQRQRSKARQSGTVQNISFDVGSSGEESEGTQSDRSDRPANAPPSCWLCGDEGHRWTQCKQRQAAEKAAAKGNGEIKLPFMPKHFRAVMLRGYSKPTRDDKSPQRKESRPASPARRQSPGGPSTSSTPKRKGPVGILKRQGASTIAFAEQATPASTYRGQSDDEMESTSEEQPTRSKRKGSRRP